MRRLRPLLLLALVAPGAPALVGCDGQSARQCDSDVAFAIEDVTPDGAELGATAVAGSCVTVDYVGRLADGSGVFRVGDGLNVLVLNSGFEVPGLILGLRDQRVGQTRRVTVPPSVGFGANEVPARDGFVGGGDSGEPYVGVPACSVLEYEVTVRRVNADARICSGV